LINRDSPCFFNPGLSRFFLFLILSAAVPGYGQEQALRLESGEELRYKLVEPGASSARATALQILKHLSSGEIEEAAVLSNAPRRRFEVLREYREQVGDTEFRRVFAQYFFPENRVIAEIAIGPRRLVIWRLGEAANHLAGQYFIEVEGKFYVDDVPSDERSRLRHVLEHYRKKSGSDPDSRPPSR
jgi:hypothetical protein